MKRLIPTETAEKEIEEKIQRIAKGVAKPYGSIVWHCDRSSAAEEVTVTFGWSLPTPDNQHFESGSWTFTCSALATENGDLFLTDVEETRGVLFHNPTRAESVVNETVERLIADYLLLFCHRALFGRCAALIPYTRDQLPPADVLLLFGPKLPKFAGRACYLLSSRSKTIGVLAPDHDLSQPPMGLVTEWDSEPYPPFSDDYAVRRWKVRDESTGSLTPRAVLDLIIPTGDGIAGRPTLGITPTLIAGKLWQEKVDIVKKIVREDSIRSQMALWNNKDVQLPRGLAKAVAAAVTHKRMQEASKAKEEIFKAVESSGGQGDTLVRDILWKSARRFRTRLQDMAFVDMWNGRSGDGKIIQLPPTSIDTGESNLGFDLPTIRREQQAAKPISDKKVDELSQSATSHLKAVFGEDIITIA